MNHQRHAAVRAIDRAGALAAEDRGRETAAVQQDQRLLPPVEPKWIASRSARLRITSGPSRGVLFAHVDDGDCGQRPVEDAALEDHALVFARHRVVIALHRRRRRSEDDERARPLTADDGDVAAVVARALVLLVRGVVLLVDDNQADLFERREDGRPRADDDVDVAAADALPLIVTLAVGEAAVLDGDALAERLAEKQPRRRASGRFPARASEPGGRDARTSAARRR